MNARKVEVHVVDNGSTDGSPEMVAREFPGVRLIRNGANAGFASAANQSWSLSKGTFWFLLNSDAAAAPGTIDELSAFLDGHPHAGVVTARLVGADGTVQHCAQPVPSVARTLLEASRLHKLLPARTREITLLGPYFSYDRDQRVGWTWGTALMCRREAVREVGPLAERFFLYGEDVDLCLRMRRRGWEVWFTPRAEVVHAGGASSAMEVSDEERDWRRLRGVYDALASNKSWGQVAALHAASSLASCIDWAAAVLRQRPTTPSRSMARFHGRALRTRVVGS